MVPCSNSLHLPYKVMACSNNEQATKNVPVVLHGNLEVQSVHNSPCVQNWLNGTNYPIKDVEVPSSPFRRTIKRIDSWMTHGDTDTLPPAYTFPLNIRSLLIETLSISLEGKNDSHILGTNWQLHQKIGRSKQWLTAVNWEP